MALVQFPYNTTHLEVDIAERNLKSVLTSRLHQFKPTKSPEQLVLDALTEPIGSRPLQEIVRDKNKVVIVTSDHTRAMPSKVTLPILLEQVRKGNPQADITILIATGLHRPTTEKEQRSMFGDEIVDNEKIVVHDAFDDSAMAFVCKLPSGASFVVNKLILEADTIICEGFIEPHFFAGFSGGRKSILPGVCSAETVNENHSARAIGHKNSKTGILAGNVIHEDMIYAVRKVAADFILNVTLDEDKEIIAAFAGDIIEAHDVGCEFVKDLSKADVVTGDIVITSVGGYPLDQNLYQSPKAASTAQACAGENGVIILIAACIDGIGGTHFEKLMLSGTPQEIRDTIMAIPDKETIPEQWCAQIFSEMLLKHKIILVTTNLDHDLVRKVNLVPASSLEEALAIGYKEKGNDAEVVVIPDGVSVIAV